MQNKIDHFDAFKSYEKRGHKLAKLPLYLACCVSYIFSKCLKNAQNEKNAHTFNKNDNFPANFLITKLDVCSLNY